MCKIVRAQKLMCQNFMKSTKRIKSKKTMILHYSIDLQNLTVVCS